MKQVVLIVTIVLLSCHSKKSAPGQNFEENSKVSAKFFQDQQSLLNACIDSIVIIKEETGCNSKKLWLKYKGITTNKDSLLSAAKVLADDLYFKMESNPNCNNKKWLLIFFFDTLSKLDDGSWRFRTENKNGFLASSKWGNFE